MERVGWGAYLPYLQGDDFLGVQNYTRTQYGPQGQLPAPQGAELTQMDYEFYPEALEHVLRRVREAFPGALIVTENGVATGDDGRRIEASTTVSPFAATSTGPSWTFLSGRRATP